MANNKSQITVTTTHTNHPIYANFLAKNFVTDPVFTYIESSIPWYKRPQTTYQIISSLLLAASHNRRALFISGASHPSSSTPPSPSQTEHNPQCTAVILPPGENLLDISALTWTTLLLRGAAWRPLLALGLAGWKKYAQGYVAPVEAAKASVFADRETYYYVAIIATGAEHRGKGLAQGVLRELTARAQREMVPVWLEASSPASRGVYRKCGFVDVGEAVVLGAGEVDGKGELVGLGEEAVGVPVFPMVWWPEGYGKRAGE